MAPASFLEIGSHWGGNSEEQVKNIKKHPEKTVNRSFFSMNLVDFCFSGSVLPIFGVFSRPARTSNRIFTKKAETDHFSLLKS